MEQLSEIDYTLLQIENHQRAPNLITAVMFYDQSTVKDGVVRFKDILTTFERSLHKSVLFRRKLCRPTGGFDTPWWIEDADFDLEYHVRHMALPQPGDWRQLCIMIARLVSRGLDMNRPLWEAYVIEGLGNVEGIPPNCFALVLKVHHAAVDGVALAEILNAIHSDKATPALPPVVKDDWKGEQAPSSIQAWRSARRNNLRRPVKLVKTLRDRIPKIREAGEKFSTGEEKKPGFTTRFNGQVSAHRVVDALVLELDEIKTVREAVEDVTVNDVIVSIVGGGMRKYLQAKGELPETSLTTACPISVREPGTDSAHGNHVGFMSISLASDVEDPLERLRIVRESARKSKEYQAAIGVNTMMQISAGLWPGLIDTGIKLINLAPLGDIKMPMQTIVSNVPGPRGDMYFAGAKMHMVLGIGPLMEPLGLFHALISGAGKIPLTFVSCREIMPDPEFYRECLQEAWGELAAAALGKSPPKRRAAPKKQAARGKTSGKAAKK